MNYQKCGFTDAKLLSIYAIADTDEPSCPRILPRLPELLVSLMDESNSAVATVLTPQD
jgi:hypothetical protein